MRSHTNPGRFGRALIALAVVAGILGLASRGAATPCEDLQRLKEAWDKAEGQVKKDDENLDKLKKQAAPAKPATDWQGLRNLKNAREQSRLARAAVDRFDQDARKGVRLDELRGQRKAAQA